MRSEQFPTNVRVFNCNRTKLPFSVISKLNIIRSCEGFAFNPPRRVQYINSVLFASIVDHVPRFCKVDAPTNQSLFVSVTGFSMYYIPRQTLMVPNVTPFPVTDFKHVYESSVQISTTIVSPWDCREELQLPL